MNSITKDMQDITRLHTGYRLSYMEPLGLRGCHANYIIALCAEPGISQEQLARRLYANKSNIARQIAFLEESGYVRRESDETDKRVMRVYPTEKALEILPLISEKEEEWEKFVTEDLTSGEIETARAILKKIKQCAEEFAEK